MKKVLLILCALALVSFTANAKEYKKEDIQECQNKKSIYVVACDSKGKPISGKVKSFYKNGKLESENNFVEGKLTKSKNYYENGNLSSETAYSEKGTKFKTYYENGKTKFSGSMKENKRDGAWNHYNENGKIRSKIIYKDGKAVSGFNYNENGTKEKITQDDLDRKTQQAEETLKEIENELKGLELGTNKKEGARTIRRGEKSTANPVKKETKKK